MTGAFALAVDPDAVSLLTSFPTTRAHEVIRMKRKDQDKTVPVIFLFLFHSIFSAQLVLRLFLLSTLLSLLSPCTLFPFLLLLLLRSSLHFSPHSVLVLELGHEEGGTTPTSFIVVTVVLVAQELHWSSDTILNELPHGVGKGASVEHVEEGEPGDERVGNDDDEDDDEEEETDRDGRLRLGADKMTGKMNIC